MAANTSDSQFTTDTSLDEMDKKCDPSTVNESSPPPSAEGSATNETTNQTKAESWVTRKVIGTVTIVLIGAFAVLALTVITAGLGVHVDHLREELKTVNDRLDKLETRCNCARSPVVNLDKEAHSDNVSSLWLAIDEVVANVSQLKSYVEDETENIKNDLKMLSRNDSVLADRVVVLENKSHDLEMTVSQFQTTFVEQLTNLSSVQENLHSEFSIWKETFSENLSLVNRSLAHLRENLAETNKRIQDVSSSQHSLELDLNVTKEALQADIATVKNKLSADIDETQTKLQNVSSFQAEIHSDLVATKERLVSSVSALNTSILVVNEEVAEMNSRLSNLSSSHEDLQEEHAATNDVIQRNISQLNDYIRTVELNHSSVLSEHVQALSILDMNVSTLSQELDDASQELQAHGASLTTLESNVSSVDSRVTNVNRTFTSKIEETNERVKDISSLQNSLEHDLNDTKGALLSNISAVKDTLTEEIIETQNQLQNVSSFQVELHLDLVATKASLASGVSSLNTSIQLVNEDLVETNSLLSNLSSSHETLHAEHTTTKASIQQNISHLTNHIRTVELNHSSVLTEHTRALSEVERNASVLTQNIAANSQELQTQRERVTTVDSRVSTVDGRVTSVHSTLSSTIDRKARELGTRIDNHIFEVQNTFSQQYQTHNGLDSRLHQVELKVNAASRVMPLGLISLILIFFFITLVTG